MYNTSSITPYEIVFDECKSELLPLKKLRRALQLRDIRTSTSRHNISPHTLSEGLMYVLFNPQRPLSIDEFSALKAFLQDTRNSLVILLSEGGEARNNTNVNYLIEELGIMANNDCVIRQVFHKYTHPKECLLSEHLLFPFGCSLNVQAPAVTLLLSGPTAYPVNRPVAALSGRVLVVGASEMFADSYVDYEQNMTYAIYLFEYMLGRRKLDKIVNEGNIYEYQYLPNLVNTAEQLRPCLLEPPRVPLDVGKLSTRTLYEYSAKKLPQIAALLEKIDVKFQPLTLIEPKFIVPLPDVKPAVYPAALEDIGGPPLELFDLDDAFMPPKHRLAQLANQCLDKDLEFFVAEAAKILGVRAGAAQDVLKHVLLTVADFKQFKYSICVFTRFMFTIQPSVTITHDCILQSLPHMF